MSSSTFPLELASSEVLATLVDSLPVGIVGLDAAGRVVVFNQHEEKLAGRTRAKVLGKHFFEAVAPCMNVKELAGEFLAGVRQGTLSTKLEFSFPFPNVAQPRDVVVRMQSFLAGGEPHGLLLIEDVSMQRSVERLKETLSALLVHDLKSPLTAVLSNVEYVKGELERPGVDTGELIEALADADVAGRRLNRMILDLLDVTRLETGTFPLARKTEDIGALLAASLGGAAAIARERSVMLVKDIRGDVAASIDGSALRRVLDNLVDNAVRHTPSGKRVVASTWSEPTDVFLEIADEGPGVAPELRERIFEKFVQVETAQRSRANHGLGLTFVRMAVRAHGGDVTVDAGPNGVGTTFRIRIPREP